MFLNLSNHPLSDWESAQIDAVPKRYGKIVDIPFPNISPELSTEEVTKLAKEYFDKIDELCQKSDKDNAVHLMGETIFVFALSTLLIRAGYTVMASTTERIVSYECGDKISTFKFVHFRQFPNFLDSI
jgi:hypothetical protein